jgi:release factor glutamine methyltransferase
MTISELLKKIKNENIDWLDIELIITKVIRKSREFVVAHPEFRLNEKQISTINNMAQKRGRGFPLAYLVASKEFYGSNFRVNKYVLIPRPETENIIDQILEIIIRNKNKKFLFYDIGTGSGCIIISLAKIFGPKNIYCASDISKQAIEIARKNASSNNVGKSISFKTGHLTDPFFKQMASSKLSMVITANLPYLTKDQFLSSPSIQFEPKKALISPKDGLGHYQALFDQLKPLCNKKFYLLCEIDPSQYSEIKKKAKKNFPLAKISHKNDLGGKKRIVIITN